MNDPHPTKTGTTSAEPLLNEGGLTITFEQIKAGEKSFKTKDPQLGKED